MANISDIRAKMTAACSDKADKSKMTHKQGGYLWRFTGVKFWEPEQIPPPTMRQASVLIDACITWNAARGAEKIELAKIIEEMIRRWFPEWTMSQLFFRFHGGSKPAAKPAAAQQSSMPPFPALPDAGSKTTGKGGQSDAPDAPDANDTADAEHTTASGDGASNEEREGNESQAGKPEQGEGEGQQGDETADPNADGEGQGQGQGEGDDEGEESEGEGEGNEGEGKESEGEGNGEGEGDEGQEQEQEQESKPKRKSSKKSKPKAGAQSEDQQEGEGEGQPEQQEPVEEKKKAKKPEKKPKLDPKVDEMIAMVKAGIRNIWMVGAAGSGKTTMAKIVAEQLDVPCTTISCGLGTSAVEFLGYKYPEREGTPFAGAFGMPSVIILDEFTALDPAVAQVANAALANGQITTTTGIVNRHADCVIIATSNTFGDGADRQYVANQQLDAATIDRFMGGIIEVSYSKMYEKRFDPEVREYVLALRKIINRNSLRRVASTRMMIQGESLKNGNFADWRMRLIINWGSEEKELVKATLGEAMFEAKKEVESMTDEYEYERV